MHQVEITNEDPRSLRAAAVRMEVKEGLPKVAMHLPIRRGIDGGEIPPERPRALLHPELVVGRGCRYQMLDPRVRITEGGVGQRAARKERGAIILSISMCESKGVDAYRGSSKWVDVVMASGGFGGMEWGAEGRRGSPVQLII
ncbi:hypothetical protein AAC387_Pa11g1072 [Persea americana]